MGSGWDFHRPFSRTDWMAGTNEMGRKRPRRSCIHCSSQTEKGWEERAVRSSISGLMAAPDNRNIIGEYITKVNYRRRLRKNLTTKDTKEHKGKQRPRKQTWGVASPQCFAVI